MGSVRQLSTRDRDVRIPDKGRYNVLKDEYKYVYMIIDTLDDECTSDSKKSLGHSFVHIVYLCIVRKTAKLSSQRFLVYMIIDI